MYNIKTILGALLVAITTIAASTQIASAAGYQVDRVGYVKVATWDHLNIRKWPAAHSQKTGELTPDSTIWVQRCIIKPGASDWCKISDGHSGGWVNSKFLEFGEKL